VPCPRVSRAGPLTCSMLQTPRFHHLAIDSTSSTALPAPNQLRHTINFYFSMLDRSKSAYIVFHATGHLDFGCVDIGAFAEKEVIQ